MSNIIPSVKGTRDFYPEDKAIHTWMYSKMRLASERFGYVEYDGPFLETIDLYAAKSGEELVKEQSYVFKDRGGDLITLRPELTPTLSRMIAQRQKQLTFPLRWWSFGPFWRYERPQKGRSREFFQWNVDIIGVDSPEADAEICAVIASFFDSVGLTSQIVKVMVNDRELMDSQLERLNIKSDVRQEVFKLIDRKDKLSPSDWEAYAEEVGLDSTQIDGLQTLLMNTNLWKESENLTVFMDAVDALGVSDYVHYAPYIIRGLDYYTGIVYEAWAIDEDVRRSILGGGRYNNLVSDVGGEPIPATGFAMGDMVIKVVLSKYALVDKVSPFSAPIFMTIFDEEHKIAALSLSTELRNAGLEVVCYPETAKLPKQLKYADRINARLAIILGPDEVSSEQVTVKDLSNREQYVIKRQEVVAEIQRLLDRNLPS